jgi:hypothetical protein
MESRDIMFISGYTLFIATLTLSWGVAINHMYHMGWGQIL